MRFGSFPEWLAEVRAVRASHLDLTADVERAQQTPRRGLIHKANSTPSRGPNVVARGAIILRLRSLSTSTNGFRLDDRITASVAAYNREHSHYI